MTEPLDLAALRDQNGYYPEDIASILSTADAEESKLLRRIGKMRIEHSKYVAAWDWLNDLYAEHGGDEAIAFEGVSGIFHGPSGTGKSTILRRFTKLNGGPFKTASADVRPVIRVSTPANPNLANIYTAILQALGAAELASKDVQDMRLAVHAQLVGQGVRMIIFDEFTHIVEDRSEKFATKTMRSLKELLNEVHCQVVFAGTEELVKIDTLYPQMRRRNGGNQPLLPFDWDDDGDKAEWYDLMKTVQDGILLKSRPNLDEEKMGRLMHQATGGIMDHLMKLLFRATSYAHRDGASHVGIGHLAQAFERLRRGDEKSPNPFGSAPVRRPKPKIVDEDEELQDEVTDLSKRKNLRDERDAFTS